MPPDEPGHKAAELNAGATPFDPNAARRYAEGRGPGMQDSEPKDPAHWVQPVSPEVALEERVALLGTAAASGLAVEREHVEHHVLNPESTARLEASTGAGRASRARESRKERLR
jgi:hypothetical protein